MLKRFFSDERGATAIEYAIIAALIFLAIIAAIAPIGTELEGVFTEVSEGFQE
ncbi:MAG TPA: Flp family type IVb pilin [Candidatus Binatia bacterium]|nr:Flp family type IVb pilin [Candidatus Binatia bacterium]